MSNCAFAGLENAVKDGSKECKCEELNGIAEQVKELMQRMERMDISWKEEKAHLENRLDTKNVEMEDLRRRLEEVELLLESRVEEVMARTQSRNEEMLRTQNNQEVLNSELTLQCRAEVKKELDKVLQEAVQQGLRDLPFEMICARKITWDKADSVVSYDRITVTVAKYQGYDVYFFVGWGEKFGRTLVVKTCSKIAAERLGLITCSPRLIGD